MTRRVFACFILCTAMLRGDVIIGPAGGNGGFVSASTNLNGSPDGWSASSGVWIDTGNSPLGSAPFGADSAAGSRFIQIHADGGETLTSAVDFTVAPGDEILLSLDYKTGGSGATPTLQVQLWDNATQTVHATLGTIASTPQASFTTRSFSHTATTAMTRLRLRFSLPAAAGLGRDVHLDRIHLFGGTVTPPEPPAPIVYDTAQVLLPDDSDARIIEKAAKLLPRPAQVAWQRLETTFFIHYGPNAFTGVEWGSGKESPAVFQPTAFDAGQWVDEIDAAGGKLVMLVVKHHDGFCLWPSRYTGHDVASSPWLDGQGNVVRAVADECAARGIQFGIYLSPADLYQIESAPGIGSGFYGNGSATRASVIPTDPAAFASAPSTGRTPPAGQPVLEYAVDDYNRYFLNQLYELLTEYGPIAEVWFDGANPKQTNPPQLYNRGAWYDLIRTLQPDAMIAIKGPDVRWVGNEEGHARETEWSPLPIPNSPATHDWADMMANDLGSRARLTRGSHLTWYPAEADVPILHGWFWAAGKSVRSTGELIDIYYASVGRNANLLLNLSPDNRGLIPDNQLVPLRGMSQVIRQTFADNLATGASASASSTLAGNEPSLLLDGDLDTWWEPAAGISTPEVIVQFPASRTFDHVVMQEAIATRGQRIESVAVDTWSGSSWIQRATTTTVGHKRIVRFSTPVTSDRLRLRILQSRLEPSLAEVSVFRGASFVVPPVIGSRDAAGNVTLSANAGLGIRYTTDGSEPTPASPAYTAPVPLALGGTLRAIAVQGTSHSFSVAKEFPGPVPTAWQVVSASSADGAHPAAQAIDDRADTRWQTALGVLPHHLTIDMGAPRWIRGFTYLPRSGGGAGTVKRFRFETSVDGSVWEEAASGEFANIRNNPVLQKNAFTATVRARYFRFTALEEIDGGSLASAAEISVLAGGFDGFLKETGMQSLPATADPNGDGLSLLHDYYFGLVPTGPHAVAPVEIVTTPAGRYFEVIRATAVPDLTPRLLESGDLESWEASAAVPLPPLVMEDGRFLDRYPLESGEDRRFYQLELTR
jgi:alpha-L-fucosidase